jgi:amino acid adenylation domain-containing protein
MPMPAQTYACNLGRAFAEMAAQHPELPAIRVAHGRDVEYAGLEALTNRLARWLLGHNAGRGSVIALQNGKSPEGYAAMLACLKIGAAYTNVDVQNPPERLGRILSVCRPMLVLCDEPPAKSLVEAAAHLGVPAIAIRDHAAELDALEPTPPPDLPAVTGADPAYVVFTSGSTGLPKGVAISHASVLNFVAWVRSVFGIGPGDVVANVNPIYFDNSVFDFYAALFSGACLAPIGRGELSDAAATVRRVDEAKCTVWFSVPSLLIYLMTMKALRTDTFLSLRSIVFGGEGYPKSELSKLFNLYGGRCTLYNVYGPTECTCICSVHRISADDLLDARGLPPLGQIADNFSYLVLDGDLPVAPGEVGELCLMGPQVGLGYYNDPERTQAAFVQNPLAHALPQRMYRTGDRVRDLNGVLDFIGRTDNQIKHMGYRIELEEIEAAINRLDYVTQTAVVYKRVRESFGHIIAHVATGNAMVADAHLRRDLKAMLPPYMVPNRFVVSSQLPKNANGKVDRVRLRDL